MTRIGTAISFAVLFAMGLAACGKPPLDRDHREETALLDTQTMAYLSMARAIHHEANLHEDGSPEKALAAMDRLIAAERPKNATAIPEVEEVLADAYARSAELAIRVGDADRGGRYVKDGLAHAPAESYFRGHLLEVDGLLEEARAMSLRDAGKPEEAEAAKRRAIEKLEAAVKMQQSVIAHALRDAGVEEKKR